MGSLFASYRPRNALRYLRKPPSTKTDIIVKILGTAQDGGIPQIGCYCKNCDRARQNPQFLRLRPSLAILDLKKNKVFVVDASPDISLQYDMIHERMVCPRSNTKNVPDGIFLTHAHIGHYTGLMFYGYEALAAEKLPVYCSQRMSDFLSNNGPWSQLVKFSNISIRPLEKDECVTLTPDISIRSFKVPHRDEYSDTLGFSIVGKKKSLLYIPDIESWKVWDRDIKAEVEKVDYALLDGTFYNPDELPGRDLSKIGHPFITTSMDTLEQVAKKGNIKIFFTHLNHSNLALNPDGEALKHILSRGFCLAAEEAELSL